MSLSAVYPQHRFQLLERHVSALMQLMMLRHLGEVDDLAYLERVWQAEVEEMHAALLRVDWAYFDQREQLVSKWRSA